jgi:uncharacterized protein YyaL (SSP411 family)
MLYDNALLARLYLHAWQITGRDLYRRITEETLDYALREMTDPLGGFYSAQDADSEGVEGKFFVWTPDEIREILGEADGNMLGGFYGVTDAGNFEGSNILNIPQGPEAFALEHGIGEEELAALIARGKPKLLAEREKRVHPFRDDKVIASWNGLMLRAFAEAGAALKRADYLAAAAANARFLHQEMMLDGNLLRTFREGQAKIPGYLEDYAGVADGYLALYEAGFRQEWLDRAVSLANRMIELFWDDGVGGFYDTGSEHEALVTRPRDVFDNAQPCGGSVASEALLRLALITGNQDYNLKASQPLRALNRLMTQAPGGAAYWLGALDFYVSQPKEIAIVGDWDDDGTTALLDVVHRRYLPNKVVVGAAGALASDEAAGAAPAYDMPLLAGREPVDGKPTAFVCQNYVCQLPVTDPEALAEQLDS